MIERRWRIGDAIVELSCQGMVMGVLNATPDSFSDGGNFFRTERAIEHGLAMANEGADIVDVGGESTRPGAEPVEAEEELRRILPVIQELRQKSSVPLSVDTSKAHVAAAALDLGASIINDVTGGRGDDQMMSLVQRRNVGFIVMHMQGEPRTMQKAPHYDDVVTEVRDFFRQQFRRALDCGVDPMNLAFDPGIGFGKTLDHNLELLANLAALRVENRPLVVGVSRKAFLGRLIGSPRAEDRESPTVALTALLRAGGADIVRVHNVKENVAAMRVTDAMLKR
jgi:dihydropteroate synthase